VGPERLTMVVDHENKRLMEVVEGKQAAVLQAALKHIPGRENVRFVALDLSELCPRLLPECSARRQQVRRASCRSLKTKTTVFPVGAAGIEPATSSV
jgi:hypothetical protein